MSEFNNEALILARESRGLTQRDLADKLTISQTTLSNIELGIALPMDCYVKEFETILDYPKSLFFEDIERLHPVHPLSINNGEMLMS